MEERKKLFCITADDIDLNTRVCVDKIETNSISGSCINGKICQCHGILLMELKLLTDTNILEQIFLMLFFFYF